MVSDFGYEGASMRAIATAAGIEQGHLAYYYPSKIALWKDVVETFARDGELRLRPYLTPELSDAGVCARSRRRRQSHASAIFAELRRKSAADTPDAAGVFGYVGASRVGGRNLRPSGLGAASSLVRDPASKGSALRRAPRALAYFSLIGSALITFGNPDLVSALAGDESSRSDWVDRAVEHMMRPILASS